MVWSPTEATGACLRTGLRGNAYEEFSCLYPTLGKTYLDWEYPSHGTVNILLFMENNPWLPITTVVCYGLAVFWGQKYMANRPAWDWRNRLAAWNLFLAAFSAVGFFRLAPHLLHNIYYYDFKTNVCTDLLTMAGFSPTMMWGLLFTWSKFFELIDTFFIIVRKKKLMFLHWYHHITVLLCCWHMVVTGSASAVIFSAINFGVHMIMYFYYFLMAIHCKPKWMDPMVITVAQLVQMVIGVSVCVGSYNYAGVDGCSASLLNNRGSLFMYASYLFLFAQFFLKRYVTVTKTKRV